MDQLGLKKCKCAFFLLLALVTQQSFAQLQTRGTPEVDSWGQSAYTVPITVPPGTAGMAPSLALTYSSRGGDGPFGLGWSLSGLSSITRCPAALATEGWVGGVRLDAYDRFCLDGQKLVVINGGTYGADGSEYRTEAETFSKVVAQGASGSGPTSFRVWTQDGLIMEYGTTADARFPSAPNGSVREWALNRVSDRSGNFYTITYSVNTATNEAVPAQIDYTGNTAAPTAPYASVRINYQARPDPETYFAGPASVGRALRATSIQTLVDGALITQYTLGYDTGPNSARSRLTSVAQCSASGTCLAAISLGFQTGGGGLVQGTNPVNLGNLGGPRSTSFVKFMKGDFNGDGIDDVVVIDNLNQARICYGPNFAATSCGVPFLVGENMLVMDYNGDGISDIAFLNGGQLRFCPGPNPEPNNQQCSAVSNQSYPGYTFIAGDFNGDGKDDLFLWNPTNGERFGFFCNDIVANIAGRFCNGGAMNPAGFRVFTGDFDGDGMTDLLLVGSSDYWVCTGYKTFVGVNGLERCSHVITGDLTTSSVLVGDFNGDGKQDIMLATPNDFQLCPGPALLTGNVCAHVPGTGGGGAPSIAQVVAGDFDGDGASDVFFARPEGGFFSSGRAFLRTGGWAYVMAGPDWRFVPIIVGNFLGHGAHDIIAGGSTVQLVSGATQAPDLLSTATDTAFGTVTSFSYLPLTDNSVYTKGTASTWPLQDIKRPWYVTSQMVVPTGVWQVTDTHSYRYEKGHVSLEGRGGSVAPFNRNFIGFELVHDTDSAKGRETVSSWLLGFPHLGRVQELTTYVGGQIAFKSTRQLDTTVTFENRTRSILRSEWVTSFGLDGDWKNTRYDYNYDLYGNPPGVTMYFNSSGVQFGDVKKQVITTYTNDAASWLFGVPSVKGETYRLPDGTQYIRKETYTGVPGTRLIQQAVHEPDVPELKVTTNYTYNAFGEATVESVVGNGYPARNTTHNYDARGRFITSDVNALNQTTSVTYDSRFGAPTSRTDPNNVTVSWQYDDLGRKRIENRPDGTQKTWDPVNCGACRGYAYNPNIASYVYVAETGRPARYEYFDELDRHIMTSRPMLNGSDWIDDDNIWYDATGKVSRNYRSYMRPDAVKPYMATTYDSYGRISTETEANGGQKVYTYSAAPNAGPITTSVRNARGYTTQFVRDVWNQLIQVIDAGGGVTSYAYDPAGKVQQITDANGNNTTLIHNKYGWVTAKGDPDLGTWSYNYDPFGNMTSQTDAKGQTTQYSYDALNRKVSQSELTQSGTWSYDASGKLTGTTSTSGPQMSYGYDAFGRLITETTTILGSTFTTLYSYDTSGRLGNLTYPTAFGNLQLAYVYNATSYLSEIRNANSNTSIWKVTAADAYGPISTELGNGVGVDVHYDASMHLPSTSVVSRHSDGAILQGFTYSYDIHGNRVAHTDSTMGLSEAYTYDALDRLTGVSGPAGKSYAFDLIGNITSKSDVGSYLYQAGKAHAVSQAGAATYGYDADGNIIAAGARTLTMTSFNLPASIQANGGTYTWTYDADHRRMYCTSPSQVVYYVRDRAGRPLYETHSYSNGIYDVRYMVYAGGRIVAQFMQGTTGPANWRYFAYDSLGSVTLATDEAGQVVDRLAYDAYGKRRFPNGQDDTGNTLAGATTSYAFTGHEYLDGLGLVHMNARLYDPLLGKFISADGRDGDSGKPQDLNRYAYVLNNPLMFVDPTGFGPHVAFQNGWSMGAPAVGGPGDGTGSDPDADFIWFDGNSIRYGYRSSTGSVISGRLPGSWTDNGDGTGIIGVNAWRIAFGPSMQFGPSSSDIMSDMLRIDRGARTMVCDVSRSIGNGLRAIGMDGGSVSIPIPFVPLLGFGISVDRFGQIYLSGGAGVGQPAVGVNVNRLARRGNGPDDLVSFYSGSGFIRGAGIINAGPGLNPLARPTQHATGIGTPGIGISYTLPVGCLANAGH